jgi:CRP-like cAMP-binding protein
MNHTSNALTELPAIGILAGLPAEHRSFLACFGKYHRPEDGELLITEGEPQDSLHVILTGKLHIVSAATGRPMLLAALGEGDSIGEINLFDPGTASASVIVKVRALVWSLSRSELDSFLEVDPCLGVGVLRGLLAQVCKRIRNTNEKLATQKERAVIDQSWIARHPKIQTPRHTWQVSRNPVAGRFGSISNSV